MPAASPHGSELGQQHCSGGTAGRPAVGGGQLGERKQGGDVQRMQQLLGEGVVPGGGTAHAKASSETGSAPLNSNSNDAVRNVSAGDVSRRLDWIDHDESKDVGGVLPVVEARVGALQQPAASSRGRRGAGRRLTAPQSSGALAAAPAAPAPASAAARGEGRQGSSARGRPAQPDRSAPACPRTAPSPGVSQALPPAGSSDAATGPGLAAGEDPGAGSPPLSPPPPWQKVLWKRQPWPDNYTDASFLEELVVNAGLVPVRRYWPVVLASVAVSQQLCTVVAALAVPAHLSFGSLSVSSLLGACAVLLALGYLTCAWLGGHLLGGSLSRGLRQCGLLVGGVLFLSPLLRSLTRTVSEDSVLSLTALLLLLHLFLHDYSFVNSVTDRLTGALALTSAVMAAVLVASLMPSDLAVFSQVLFSLEVYLLWPYARRYIHRSSAAAHVALTLLLAAASGALLWPLSRALTLLFLVALLMITFVCPWWLVSSHKFKAKINGPWDEAVPHIPRELMWAAGKAGQQHGSDSRTAHGSGS